MWLYTAKNARPIIFAKCQTGMARVVLDSIILDANWFSVFFRDGSLNWRAQIAPMFGSQMVGDFCPLEIGGKYLSTFFSVTVSGTGQELCL